MKKNIGKAIRPIFIPCLGKVGVEEVDIDFDWHLGMSEEVRKRSIKSLHEEAKKKGFKKTLEASSKSDQELGLKLSAFNLKSIDGYSVENLFQSSKLFDKGGPYRDLLLVTPIEAKKDKRLKESGLLIMFQFNKKTFPLEPKSLFYDWLYLQVLFSDKNKELRTSFLCENFDSFSDIEFNPKKSFSCQARTLALCVSLYKNDRCYDFINEPIKFALSNKIYNKVQYQKELFDL